MDNLNQVNPESTPESQTSVKPKMAKKKMLILISAGVVLVAIVLILVLSSGSVFDKYVDEMLSEYPYADNAVAADGSYLKIDTNPDNKDYSEMTAVQQQIYPKKEEDSLKGIKFMNSKLGFNDSVYSKMTSTTALMGRQTEENSKYKLSWTYHPDKGLEVMYEKK